MPDPNCEFCGDQGEMFLHARCHLTAPLQVSLDGTTIILRCYIPECMREVARFTIVRPPKPRSTADDIGFDEHGQAVAIGAEAGEREAAIVDDPNAQPVLQVARVGDDLGVRVYGPPSEKTADLLDHVAATYRQAVAASRGTQQ